jgi:hypothetical protein
MTSKTESLESEEALVSMLF